ncbi:DEAD/DEAH box helicase [Vibrio parahaemolyticus]|nr:DEAD/DEAH box helicase [Vibrio parahaemolyticus]ELA9388532.1 DEAD/DEAH box helicase [Vibrio parahaemolyticus]HBC3358709.1 DEAD/DEAH box helicase [Vibrio parahaemolyticus]HBC3870164.1 DEAD/DEAH box helicase [Vibrio parahaemolyticus]HCG8529002.1 DEAD/DEAH box helicase [Vibrio parahaemolyticus]
MSERLDIQVLVKKLEKASIQNQLPSSFTSENTDCFTEQEIRALVSYASVLSLEAGDQINESYEIITRLLEQTNGNSKLVKAAAEVILSRIGNFPGRELLRRRYAIEGGIPAPLRLEIIARESENTIIDETENEIQLTDFQLQLFKSLESEQNLSISAPTSAGKSFVLNLSISNQIKERICSSIIYVVPTRALISEVSMRVRSAIKRIGQDKAIIRTTPFPVDRKKIRTNVVYIFTQERLMSFLSATDAEPEIDTLIIDEAHEIQNGKRGIILQTAIDIALRKFSNTKLLFASPLIQNPEYFLSLFKRTSNGKFFTEVVSPVSQNILLVNQVARKPAQMHISLLNNKGSTEIGEFTLPFPLRNSKPQQIANLALSLSDDDSVIAFSNTPSSAEERAVQASTLAKNIDVSEDIETFISFIEQEIHPNYALINCLRKGIAFHYGNMPSLLRTGVEELFRKGDIKIVFCTSTLLQGVNLPAKHIIIENPKSGDKGMTRADFLNLAGRAGRLLNEFHGNVWCIRPEEWDSSCYSGDKLQTITSSISNILVDGGTELQKAINTDISEDSWDEKRQDEADVAIGKLYNDYLDTKDFSFMEQYRTDINSEELDQTIEAVKSLEVTLPEEIIKRNQSLRPDQLDRLYKYLLEQDNVEDFYPIYPYQSGAKVRVEKILGVLEGCFQWQLHEKFKPWLSYLAYQWVWGVPIGKILHERVSFLEDRKGSDNINPTREVRSCLKVLETDIRFKMVKYFSAYLDILKYIALEKELESAETIEPYHIYLEFGSCKKSVLNLMSVGLSRFTAIHLDKCFNFSQSDEPEGYLSELQFININKLNMPRLCINEVAMLIA